MFSPEIHSNRSLDPNLIIFASYWSLKISSSRNRSAKNWNLGSLFDFCATVLSRKNIFSLKSTIKKSDWANFSGKQSWKAFVVVNFEKPVKMEQPYRMGQRCQIILSHSIHPAVYYAKFTYGLGWCLKV